MIIIHYNPVKLIYHKTTTIITIHHISRYAKGLREWGAELHESFLDSSPHVNGPNEAIREINNHVNDLPHHYVPFE